MVIVIGGGIVGLVLAAGLAKAQIPVTVVENKLPELQWQPQQFDARVSAINLVSQQILVNLNIWRQLATESVTPLRALQVWDHLGGGEIQFECAEIGKSELGFIIENRALIKALWEHLAACPSVTILCPSRPDKIIYPAGGGVQLILEDQTILPAELIVGADGSHSWVREQMGVKTQERSYEQQALITVVHSVRSHQNTGWQSFLPTGPLGVLPLADNQTSAIVWSNTLAQAQRLMLLSPQDFNQELTQALGSRLGMMTALAPIKQIPLIMRHAEQYVQPYFALIGDAAHTIHPLAGQGVNLGLLDAAVLAQVIAEAHHNRRALGALTVLRRYQRWRKADNTTMLAAMRGFKELFGSSNPWLTQLRSQGLSLTNQLPVIKNLIMRYAVGRSSDLPDLAKIARGQDLPPDG